MPDSIDHCRAFFERCQPGVFVVESPAVAQELVAEARERRLFVAWMGVENIANHEAFLAEVARALSFPDYFGQNWDAFDECIRDLSWLPARGYVLVLAGFDRLSRSDPANWAIGLDVLKEAATTWSRTTNPMFVLLHGPGDAAVGVPPLRCLSPPNPGDGRGGAAPAKGAKGTGSGAGGGSPLDWARR